MLLSNLTFRAQSKYAPMIMLISLSLISYEYYKSMFCPLGILPSLLSADSLKGCLKVRDGSRNIKCPSLNATCKIWSFHVNVLLKRGILETLPLPGESQLPLRRLYPSYTSISYTMLRWDKQAPVGHNSFTFWFKYLFQGDTNQYF